MRAQLSRHGDAELLERVHSDRVGLEAAVRCCGWQVCVAGRHATAR